VTSYAYDAMSRRTQVVNNAIQTAPLLQLAYSPDRLLAPRSGSATNRGRCSHPNLVWPAPPLRSDMIFGKHS
jgi:hypothetical protein